MGYIRESYPELSETIFPNVSSRTHYDDSEPGLTWERPDWWDRANCLGVGVDVFFHDGTDQYQTARDICAGCPVSEQCSTWVLSWEAGRRYGMWGGLSPNERRAYAARLRRIGVNPRPRVERHGMLSEYQRGCRCEQCREARRRQSAKDRRTA